MGARRIVQFNEMETAKLLTTHCIKQSFLKKLEIHKNPLAISIKIYIIRQEKFIPKGGQAI
jgi:hypothetical protein